jgi:hypothetical protein
VAVDYGTANRMQSCQTPQVVMQPRSTIYMVVVYVCLQPTSCRIGG